MKVTIIGRWGAYPAKGEATSCYLIEVEQYKFVLDLGSGSLSQLSKLIDLSEIDAVFISHLHADHVADLMTLQYAALVDSQLGKRKKKLDIYLNDLEECIHFEHPESLNISRIHAGSEIKIESILFSFCETIHDIPTLAVKIQWENQTIVYTSDTAYSEKVALFANAANLLIAECSFYASQQSVAINHSTSTDVAKIMNLANPKKTILTHLPHYGCHQQLVEEVMELTNYPVELAKSLMEIKLRGEVNNAY